MPGRRARDGQECDARKHKWHLCLGTGNRHQPFFGCCPRGVRNWKQACPIFSDSASTCPGQVARLGLLEQGGAQVGHGSVALAFA